MPNKNVDLNLTAKAWADITIEDWENKIQSLGITDTLALLESFQTHVFMASGGNIDRIEFIYLNYGKYIEMAVGKGVRIEDVGILSTARKKRMWFTPVFFRHVKRLGEILAQKYGQKSQLVIIENLQTPIK